MKVTAKQFACALAVTTGFVALTACSQDGLSPVCAVPGASGCAEPIESPELGCEEQPLHLAVSGDGCCPRGASPEQDSDCPATTCVPRTCAQLQVACGTVDDGCGTTLYCGPHSDACDATTACRHSDGCCPAGCALAADSDCPASTSAAITLGPEFAPHYRLLDLGTVPGVPTRVGGVVVTSHGTLLVGGQANTESGELYEVEVARDGESHITGYRGLATSRGDAAYNDGGMVFEPGGVLFLTRWPINGLGQRKPGSSQSDKVVDLTPLGVGASVSTDSAAGLTIVPPGLPGAGKLKLVTWSSGHWYTLGAAPDGQGTFNITRESNGPTLGGGPEGITYVPTGSPGFPSASVLVAEYSAGAVAAYQVDASGDPIVATRRAFIVGLTGAEGATIDPWTGDLLFTTFGGGDRLVVVRGFSAPQACP